MPGNNELSTIIEESTIKAETTVKIDEVIEEVINDKVHEFETITESTLERSFGIWQSINNDEKFNEKNTSEENSPCVSTISLKKLKEQLLARGIGIQTLASGIFVQSDPSENSSINLIRNYAEDTNSSTTNEIDKNNTAVNEKTIVSKRENENELQYKCEECSKMFEHVSSLELHKRMHNEGRPHECQVCHQRFKQTGHLKLHEKVHTREKYHKCEICHKSYSRAADLKRHRSVHNKEKNVYKCEVCFEMFTYVKELKDHSAVHTEKQLFTCEVCSKSYIRFGNLKRHRSITAH
ncbi:zinc finger protein 681-like [Daktulosphaira vitifoliae]|uniref:zinc finger protein 681-like n=1 Tax=Daktulosphaira vitifoliae TaxID=58002 RepID=UPI0021A9EBF6|nr:zinc finger protein 681-like [Daktulosphaira vitifoliae]